MWGRHLGLIAIDKNIDSFDEAVTQSFELTLLEKQQKLGYAHIPTISGRVLLNRFTIKLEEFPSIRFSIQYSVFRIQRKGQVQGLMARIIIRVR